MEYQTIIVSKANGKAVITVNRPETLNAINDTAMYELQQAFENLINDREVRVIILTGQGQKAFISGGDIATERALDSMAAYRFSMAGHKLAMTIEHSPKPVIAAVNGYALGGGCEIALACDLRIASENAKFGTPEIKLGTICGLGGTVRLPRLVGKTKAKELLLLGNMIDAAEAYRIGLINRVVPQERLMEEVNKIADELAAKSLIALEFTKRAVDWGMETDMQTALLHEAELFGLLGGSQDKYEGMTAFLEKRAPKFQDR